VVSGDHSLLEYRLMCLDKVHWMLRYAVQLHFINQNHILQSSNTQTLQLAYEHERGTLLSSYVASC
jgi:hypothetical protein